MSTKTNKIEIAENLFYIMSEEANSSYPVELDVYNIIKIDGHDIPVKIPLTYIDYEVEYPTLFTDYNFEYYEGKITFGNGWDFKIQIDMEKLSKNLPIERKNIKDIGNVIYNEALNNGMEPLYKANELLTDVEKHLPYLSTKNTLEKLLVEFDQGNIQMDDTGGIYKFMAEKFVTEYITSSIYDLSIEEINEQKAKKNKIKL
jgi:hypothetical protein